MLWLQSIFCLFPCSDFLSFEVLCPDCWTLQYVFYVVALASDSEDEDAPKSFAAAAALRVQRKAERAKLKEERKIHEEKVGVIRKARFVYSVKFVFLCDEVVFLRLSMRFHDS